MDRVTTDAFADDKEVRLYMKDNIKNDTCLCKKYGKATKRKPCPVCCGSHTKGEPMKKNRKNSRIPTGNYGRTGCLAKPDLCTIPEHDIVSTSKDERAHKFTTKTRNKCSTSIVEIKRNDCRDLTGAAAHCNGRIGKNYTDDSKLKKRFKAIAELDSKLKDTDNDDAKLLDATDKCRVKTYGSVEECFGLKNNKETVAKFNILHFEKCSNSESSAEESHLQWESQKPGDASCVYRTPVQCCQSKQRPKLIPAREFIRRYFDLSTSPSKNRNLGDNEMPDLEDSSLEAKDEAKDKRDDDINATDAQKIINGFSCITINTSNEKLKGNEKSKDLL